MSLGLDADDTQQLTEHTFTHFTMCPQVPDWNNEQILTIFFETHIKVRQRVGFSGRALGYKYGLEAFRVSGQVPCRFIPEGGKIMRNMIDAIRNVKVLLRIVKQTSWHYIEIKYGRQQMQMFLKMDVLVTPEWIWAWKDKVMKNLDYDHADKLTDTEFTQMVAADSLANICGKPVSLSLVRGADFSKKVFRTVDWNEALTTLGPRMSPRLRSYPASWGLLISSPPAPLVDSTDEPDLFPELACPLLSYDW